VLSESDFAPEPEFGLARSRGGSHRHLSGDIAPLSDIASDVDADVEAGSVQGGDGDGGVLEQETRALSLVSDDETSPATFSRSYA
jgi:hypothetical protein